ncbi:MAG: VOC family protein [Bacteroidales bacterium]
MSKQMYLNLPVKNLNDSIAFFTKLGFTFNPQFSNEESTCLVVGENIFVMLLIESRFKEYTRKELANPQKTTEMIVSFDAESREAVDKMIALAIESGGDVYAEPVEHGWLYSRSFDDIDGHQWEVFYFDPSAMPAK